MAEVLEMNRQRRRLAAKRGFQGWSRRFPESFDEDTCIAGLSDATLAALIQSGGESSMPLYELILGVLDLGMGPRFYFLETPDKLAVMDIALFLLDQLRFEAMRRLGWVEDWSTLHVPLIDLVEQFSSRFSTLGHQTPPLSPLHPQFGEYQETFEGDRRVFIRKLIPEALEQFGKSVHGS